MTKEKSIAELIFNELKYSGKVKTLSDWAKQLGYSESNLSNIVNGRRGIPTTIGLKLIDLYKVRKEFLATGKGLIFQEEENKQGVPVYNLAFEAGNSLEFGDSSNQILGYINLDGFKSCVGFIFVKGSSMYPKFMPGDIIGLEPLQDLDMIEYGQPYAIETHTEQRFIKLIRRGKDNDNLIMKSIHPEYDDMDLPKKKIRKLFKVHGPIRDQFQ